MNQSEYNIVIHSKSWLLIMVAIFSGIILSLSPFLFMVIGNQKLIQIAGLVLVVCAIRLAAELSKLKATIIVDNHSIRHIWDKNNRFNKEDDFTIPWETVTSCGDHSNRIFEVFEINLNNRTRYQLHRVNFLN